MKITYYDLLGLIEDKESPKEVYLLLHTNKQEKVKYYWDEYSECYVINDETQEDDNYNFYLRDSLLDGQSFEALIEIIEEPKEELEEIELIDIHYVDGKCIFKIYGQSIEETIAIKVNELIDEVNKLKKERIRNNE